MKEFLNRIRKRHEGTDNDWTPKQVKDQMQQALEEDEFEILEPLFQPSEEDIRKKELGLND